MKETIIEPMLMMVVIVEGRILIRSARSNMNSIVRYKKSTNSDDDEDGDGGREWFEAE
jgi:hypothetical protein